mgnify:CR=1 FL=1
MKYLYEEMTWAETDAAVEIPPGEDDGTPGPREAFRQRGVVARSVHQQCKPVHAWEDAAVTAGLEHMRHQR